MSLDTKAQEDRLKQAIKNAGKRYNSVINLEVKSIKSNLYALNRDSQYVAELLRLTYKVKKELSYFTTTHLDKENEIKILKKDVKIVVDRLLSIKTKSKNQNISWSPLSSRLSNATKLSNEFYWFLKGLQDEERKVKGEYAQTSIDTGNTWSLYQALDSLNDFINDGVKTNIFTTPRMILKGEAGIGKTHLLCDYASDRIKDHKPVLIFLAHELIDTKSKDPIARMATLMGYAKNSDFIKDLEKLSASSTDRVCIIVDAINEADQINWSHLSSLFNIKGLSLVVSVRNGYEKLIPNSKKYSSVEHFGFAEMEWDAVSTFFKHYKMKMPEIPIIDPEFRNPLFLMIFCEAYAGKTNKTFKGKGATHVFEHYVETQSKKALDELGLKLVKDYLWNNVIKTIGKWMGDNQESRILQPQLLKIIKNDAQLAPHATKLISLMEHHGLLLKYPRYTKTGKRSSYSYTFTYNRFSDHLIVRSLLTENNINSKESAENFFADGTFLDANIYNTGLLEALSIQIPERCDKTEFVWIIPEKYRSDSSIKEAFLGGVKWRDVEVDGFNKKTNDLKYIDESQVKDYINKYLLSGYDFDRVIDCLYDVCAVPNHPLNAFRMHKIFSRHPMPKRDSWIQSYLLNTSYESGNAISRLQSWSISELPKGIKDKKSVLLAGIAMSWTLTSTHNSLRDRSTRALVSLFRYHLDSLLDLLKTFSDIDDPYIAQRLYAVAYGAVSLNQQNKKQFREIATWLYKNHFLNIERRPDALMDDYARGVIELYIKRYGGSGLHIKASNITPPFSYYKFPSRILTTATLKKKYYKEDDHTYSSIWGSLMHGEGGAFIADFGNYTLGGSLRGFTNTPLGTKLTESTRAKVDTFIGSLNKKQKSLLDEYKSKKFSNIRTLFSVIGIDSNNKDIQKDTEPVLTKEEVSESLERFKKSLSPIKLLGYKKYKSYITGDSNYNKQYEDFDLNIARRWIFNRVIKLGWNPDLHNSFDRSHGSYDRTQTGGVERIGKKYQWIGLHEFLALLGSNYYFSGDSWADEKPATFRGAYQTYTRDIDPTIDPLWTTVESDKSDTWWKPTYNSWGVDNWAFSKKDIPAPKSIIETEYNNEKFVNLLSWAAWNSEKEVPEDADNRRYFELWLRAQGYIVHKKDLKSIIDWCKDKRFYNNTLPQPTDSSGSIFLSEFPDSSAYKDTFDIYEPKNGWIKDDGRSFDVMQPIIEYSGSFDRDKTFEHGVRVYGPSISLRKLLKITSTDTVGRYKSKNKKIIMFDPSIPDPSAQNALLVNRDAFIRTLDKKGLTIIWSILGEKLYHNNGNYNRHRLEVNGLCYLDAANQIVEDVRYKIR